MRAGNGECGVPFRRSAEVAARSANDIENVGVASSASPPMFKRLSRGCPGLKFTSGSATGAIERVGYNMANTVRVGIRAGRLKAFFTDVLDQLTDERSRARRHAPPGLCDSPPSPLPCLGRRSSRVPPSTLTTSRKSDVQDGDRDTRTPTRSPLIRPLG